MDAARILTDLLHETRISKSHWSVRSGVSRSLLDDYLKGRVQPSVAQLERLLAATGHHADIQITAAPTPASTALVDVLELGELFTPSRPDAPLPDLRHVWQRRRHA